MRAEQRESRLLVPVGGISEILFGFVMAVSIAGSLSLATTAGRQEVRTVLAAASNMPSMTTQWNCRWGSSVDPKRWMKATAPRRAAGPEPGLRARALLDHTQEHSQGGAQTLGIMVKEVAQALGHCQHPLPHRQQW